MFVILALATVALTVGSPITPSPTTVKVQMVGEDIPVFPETSSSPKTPEVSEIQKTTSPPEMPKYKVVVKDEKEIEGLRYHDIPIYALESSPSDDGTATRDSQQAIKDFFEEEFDILLENNENRNEILSNDGPGQRRVVDFVLKGGKKAGHEEKKSTSKKSFAEETYGGYLQENQRSKSSDGEPSESTSTTKAVTKPTNPTTSSLDLTRVRFQSNHKAFPFAFEDVPIASKWSPYLDDAFYPLSAFPEA